MRMTTQERNHALSEARTMREGWIKAEIALMTSQEYRMGTRMLRRADLSEIRKSVEYWDRQINQLTGRSGIRIKQVQPVE